MIENKESLLDEIEKDLGDLEDEELNFEENLEENLELESTEDEDEDEDEGEGEGEDEFPELDISAIKAIEHQTRSAVGNNAKASDVRIVNTTKSGKRIMLKPKVLEELGADKTVEFGMLDNTLIITKEGIADIKYDLKKQGNIYTVYNSKLVEDIAKDLELDFRNCSSIGLSDIRYVVKDNKKFLMGRK